MSLVNLLVSSILVSVLFGFTPSAIALAAPLDSVSTPIEVGRTIGAVGGNTVDQVYRVKVPANALLIVELQGETGSELGLYLFASDAESVVEDTPFAQSAKPGGYQVLRIFFTEETDIIVNVNGRNIVRPYTYTLDVLTVIDRSAPIITKVNVPDAARSERLCVTMTIKDPQSGIRAIEVQVGTPMYRQLFSRLDKGQVCASFVLEEGIYPLTILVTNRAGLVSSFTSSVRIDNSPPQLVNDPEKVNVVDPSRARITWRFNEKLRLLYPLDKTVRVFLSTGERVRGEAKLSPSRKQIEWIATKRLVKGSVLVASVTGLGDSVGNVLNTTSASAFVALAKSNITLNSVSCSTSTCKINLSLSRTLVGKSLGVYGSTARGWQLVKAFQLRTTQGSLSFSRAEMDTYAVKFIGDDEVRATSTILADEN